jgi:hypothetical protein
MLKAAVAIIAGFLSIGVLAEGLDFLFQHLFPPQTGQVGEFRSAWMLWVMLGCTFFSCAWGGSVTAAIARKRALGSGLILAALIVLATLVNMVAVPSRLPLWWKALCVTLEGPATVLGAWLRACRTVPVRSAA